LCIDTDTRCRVETRQARHLPITAVLNSLQIATPTRPQARIVMRLRAAPFGLEFAYGPRRFAFHGFRRDLLLTAFIVAIPIC
jgi:hypothetical protein